MELAKTILTERSAEFTSSQIYKLMSKGRGSGSYGKAFSDYVTEKAMESVLRRRLDTQANADPLAWGNLCESVAFDMLPLEYSLVSKKRYTHLDLPWSGMPDTIRPGLVGDIKCPWTLKSFMQLAVCEDLKEYKPEYYWQLVSNAILCNKSEAELFLFMPREFMIKDILFKAEREDSIIKYKSPAQLPFMPDDCKIPSLYIKKVEIHEGDKEALIDRVTIAESVLQEQITKFKSLCL